MIVIVIVTRVERRIQFGRSDSLCKGSGIAEQHYIEPSEHGMPGRLQECSVQSSAYVTNEGQTHLWQLSAVSVLEERLFLPIRML